MRVMIGMPWYDGADADTEPLYMDIQMYFGALRERSIWREALGHEKFMEVLQELPPLDEGQGSGGLADPNEEDWKRLGKVEFILYNYSRLSLVGKARELIVDMALETNCDYLFWWDDDMRFEHSAFLRLWRHQKPMVGALAFTARHPIHPTIYRIVEKHDPNNAMTVLEGSDIVLDYPHNALVGSEDIGGELATGGAVVLYDMKVFKEIPKPWFTATGCGEDWFFCHRMKEHKIQRYVDTGVKTQHKEHMPRWCDEASYWQERELAHEAYVKQFGEDVHRVVDGKLQVPK